MTKATEKEKSKKLPPWAGWAIGYAMTLAAAVGLVYFWRVVFFVAGPQLPFLQPALGVALVFTVLYMALFCICRFAKKNLPLKAALCVFILGLLFCFCTAPLQAPDEVKHYTRAYAISMGRLDYNGQRTYPDDVDLLLDQFQRDMNHDVRYSDKSPQLATRRIAEYKQDVAEGAVPREKRTESEQQLIWPYVLQAVFMAVTRLFGGTALELMYAGRVANLLLYAVIAYFTFKNCDKYRGVFFAVAMLPISLFMAASCSFDALMLSLCFLAISYFCKQEIYTRDIIVFGLAVAFASVIKPHNIVLVAVLLLVPKARWKTKRNPWIALGVIVVAALAMYWGFGELNGLRASGYESLNGRDEAASPMGQLLFVLKNPFAFASRVGLTLLENAAFVFSLGTFGRLDMPIPLVDGLCVMSLCAASALGIQQKEDTKNGGAVGLGLAALLYAGASVLGIYIVYSGYTSIRVTGLQPRYFLPAILLAFMLFSILLGKAVRPRLAASQTMARTEEITLWIVAAIALVSVVIIAQNYFIGQWLPNADGTYKLINIFGWVKLPR